MNPIQSISVNDGIPMSKHTRNDGTELCKGMKSEGIIAVCRKVFEWQNELSESFRMLCL
jgi:hypothetical protein